MRPRKQYQQFEIVIRGLKSRKKLEQSWENKMCNFEICGRTKLECSQTKTKFYETFKGEKITK
jgi:hypothetical protein